MPKISTKGLHMPASPIRKLTPFADKAKLSEKYKITDIGDCKWILNMAVIRDRINKTIKLSQHPYMEECIQRSA